MNDARPETPAVPAADPAALRRHARRIRQHVVEMCAAPHGGHLGGSLSVVDILTALYFGVLRVDPARPRHPGRDILLLSKGHSAIALYATLAERGFLPLEWLATYARAGSVLLGHPGRDVPGVEAPTGSLGHGLAVGVGHALAARIGGVPRRTVVILGDGELQEGSVWEAALAAAHHGLDRLVAVVDRNRLQLTGTTEAIGALEPLAAKWAAFGWAVRKVDGHDPGEIVTAVSGAPWQPGRPCVVLAATDKGHGIASATGKPAAHFATLSPGRIARLRDEVSEPGDPR